MSLTMTITGTFETPGDWFDFLSKLSIAGMASKLGFGISTPGAIPVSSCGEQNVNDAVGEETFDELTSRLETKELKARPDSPAADKRKPRGAKGQSTAEAELKAANKAQQQLDIDPLTGEPEAPAEKPGRAEREMTYEEMNAIVKKAQAIMPNGPIIKAINSLKATSVSTMDHKLYPKLKALLEELIAETENSALA
jgi:hypothetical protein